MTNPSAPRRTATRAADDRRQRVRRQEGRRAPGDEPAPVHAAPGLRHARGRERRRDGPRARRGAPRAPHPPPSSTPTPCTRAASACSPGARTPAHFVRAVRPLFAVAPARPRAVIRAPFGMLGRTYSTGHEPDLEHVLLRRPIQNVMNEAYPWHVWYPLRRTGEFARLDGQTQGTILREHAQIGNGLRPGASSRTTCGSPVTAWTPRTTSSSSASWGRELHPAQPPRADHAQDASDLGVHREDGPLLRRPRSPPERLSPRPRVRRPRRGRHRPEAA